MRSAHGDGSARRCRFRGTVSAARVAVGVLGTGERGLRSTVSALLPGVATLAVGPHRAGRVRGFGTSPALILVVSFVPLLVALVALAGFLPLLVALAGFLPLLVALAGFLPLLVALVGLFPGLVARLIPVLVATLRGLIVPGLFLGILVPLVVSPGDRFGIDLFGMVIGGREF